MLMFLGVLSYGTSRFEVEKQRLRRWTRQENLDEVPTHHLHNRGGVLLEKQYYGMEKYHRDGRSQDEWYAKVYPTLFTMPGAEAKKDE